MVMDTCSFIEKAPSHALYVRQIKPAACMWYRTCMLLAYCASSALHSNLGRADVGMAEKAHMYSFYLAQM